MELRKQIDALIEIEYQMEKLYEKVKNAELYGDEEKLKKNLEYIHFLSEIEEEKIQKLKIDKNNFMKLVYLLNSDNYLQLLFSIDESTRLPNFKVNMDNINEACWFLYDGIQSKNKRIKPNLNSYLCNTINHPVIKRLF